MDRIYIHVNNKSQICEISLVKKKECKFYQSKLSYENFHFCLRFSFLLLKKIK